MEIEKFLSKGMDDYISKPVGIKELSDTIKRVSKNISRGDSGIIKKYLKIHSDESNQELTEINYETRKFIITNLKQLYSYLKGEEKTSRNYLEIERLAHNIKLKAEESELQVIKKLAFKIELAARKKDDISVKNILNEIYNKIEL